MGAPGSGSYCRGGGVGGWRGRCSKPEESLDTGEQGAQERQEPELEEGLIEGEMHVKPRAGESGKKQ